MSAEYKCQKCKKKIAKDVHWCDHHQDAYHPGCIAFHKITTRRGEKIRCNGPILRIDVETQKMMEVMDNKNEEAFQDSATSNTDETAPEGSNPTSNTRSSSAKKRKLAADDLRQLVQTSMRNEIGPLIDKIDELQKEIIASKNEVISLSQTIANFTNQRN